MAQSQRVTAVPPSPSSDDLMAQFAPQTISSPTGDDNQTADAHTA